MLKNIYIDYQTQGIINLSQCIYIYSFYFMLKGCCYAHSGHSNRFDLVWSNPRILAAYTDLHFNPFNDRNKRKILAFLGIKDNVTCVTSLDQLELSHWGVHNFRVSCKLNPL